MIINLSKIDFGGVAKSGGGNAKPEEVFDVQPTTSDQTITPTEGSVFSGGTVRAVTSSIDVNITSNNIKEGVTILGVEGSHKGEKPEESFNVQPTTSEQTITPTEGYAFSGGTVHAVTSSIDSNIQPENIKEGVSILGVAGTLSGGGSDVFVVPSELRFAYSTFTEIPSNWDFSEFSNVTDLNHMFYGCKITTVPQLNTSSVTNASYMFARCSNLKNTSQLQFSNVTDASYMFWDCKNLEVVSFLDFSRVTNAEAMFRDCSRLVTVPQLDLSSATNVSYLFCDCSSLTTVSPLNTFKATTIDRMFDNCRNLTTVEGVDFSGLTLGPDYLFGWHDSMPKITRFIVNGKINVTINSNYSIYALTAIDYDSVKSILAAADRTDNTKAKRLGFNRTMTDQNGELAALVASCTSKGWTIYGLTLQ